MRVLNLVTNDHATFFRNQVEILERRGVEFTTLAVPGRESDDPFQGRTVLDYARFFPSVLRHAVDGYDLVHGNYGLTAPFALAQPNLPVVLSLWGSDLFGKYGSLSRWCARRCDAVIVMSHAMESALGTESEVIPHGVDFDMFHPRPRQDACADLGWDVSRYNVLFPYSPSQTVKDYPRAERIVERVRDRVDGEVVLQTVSGVPHEHMPTYMNAADALLLTSRHEGSPNAVKEALACNVPVVSTDVGDVATRLDGVSPSFVGMADEGLAEALASILERGDRSNGRERVQDVSLDRMGERIHAVYESVVDTTRATGSESDGARETPLT